MKKSVSSLFFFHLSKMQISDNEITIGNEILNTNTMTVTTIDDPSKELIPSISLQGMIDYDSTLYIKSIPYNLNITIKNGKDELYSSGYRDGFNFNHKMLNPNTTIEFELDGKTHMCLFESLLANDIYPIHLQQDKDRQQFLFDVRNCYMPVVLELYYNFSWYRKPDRKTKLAKVKIRTGLLEELNDILFIPGPLLEEILRYNHITFIVSSVRPDFFKSQQEVYQVKSTKKNRCKFYDEFLKLWNIFLNQAPLPDKLNFYILFEKWNLKIPFRRIGSLKKSV